MSNTIAAVLGTRLLIPELLASGQLRIEEHPIIAWEVDGAPYAGPVFPCFVPAGMNRSCGIEHGEDGYITAPAGKLTFRNRDEWEVYAENCILHDRRLEEERPEPGDDMQTDLDAGDRQEIEEALGGAPESPDDDTREYGTSADPERSRRTKAEIAEDEAYLAAVEATGKTIRAANSRFKKLKSRAAVLSDLRGEPALASEPEPAEEPKRSYGDDDDLLG